MKPSSEKLLYFIKSPDSNLKAVETFLNKRNFDVRSQDDLKEALTQIIDLQPDFVFLAWDHENPRAQQLPTFINQTSAASVIIPFITSNTKEASRKLNICHLNPKLYPPISGPAIERLVLKFQKNSNSTELAETQQLKSKMQVTEDLVKIKSMAMASFESGLIAQTDAVQKKSETDHQVQAKKNLTNSQTAIRQRNSVFKKSAELKLDADSIAELKKSFENQVQKPLENLLQTLDDSSEESPSGNEADQLSSTYGGVIIQKGLLNPEGLGTVIQKNGPPNMPIGSVILENAVNSDKSASVHDFSAYCVSVISEKWCGYLIVTTKARLDFSSIDLAFSEWVRSQLPGLVEFDETDYFQFEGISPDTITRMTAHSDYSEQATILETDFWVSFFCIDPEKMRVILSTDETLIQISTEELPADKELPFNLLLHLPVNQKYLTYTQAQQSLSAEQKKRLMTNKVSHLYTPIENERDYRKFKAEMNIREIYSGLARKFSVV